MDKNAIKKYAVWARRELIARVSQKALRYGITETEIVDAAADSVNGQVLSAAEKKQRQALIAQIREKGFEQVMEEVAYTWFNRFSALRFMEVNGYLPSHVRVFTDDENNFKPQIITEAIHLELDGLDMEKVYALKEADKTEELFKYLLIVQCNALNSILPGMFQRIEDYTELLLPDNLLREGSVVEQMIAMIPEDDWQDQVQIIGWLYQYYNTEPKDTVFANLKKNIKISKENIPAATQLFTPDWIVRYMVENSLGRLWLEGHPNDELKGNWKYYLDEAEQEPNVQVKLAEIRKEYAGMTPEEIKCIDPCSGSGHILAYLFDVLVQIYESYGYTSREAVASIVEHNIYGLDIDDRAAQLAYFSVMMKARQYDRRFFSRGIQPHVYTIEESNHVDSYTMDYFCNGDEKLTKAMNTIIHELHDAKEYGSILNVTQQDWSALYDRFDEIYDDIHISRDAALKGLLPLVRVAETLAQKYDIVVTNPPYMAMTNASHILGKYVSEHYPMTKTDLYSVFIERCGLYTSRNGYYAMITQQSWLSLPSFVEMRKNLLSTQLVTNMAQLGSRSFDEISGEVVSSVVFVINNNLIPNFSGHYSDLQDGNSEAEKERMYLSKSKLYLAKQDSFNDVPNCIIVYDASEKVINKFKTSPSLKSFVVAKPGMQTSDNERFLRLWFEIGASQIGYGFSHDEATQSDYKWFPYNKGIGYRKWYGNNDYVVNFYHDGEELKHWLVNNPKDPGTKHWSRNMRNYDYYFNDGITFTAIGNAFSARLNGPGYLFDTKGPMMFGKELTIIGGFVNSVVFDFYNRMLCKQITKSADSVNLVPFELPEGESRSQILQLVNETIELSKLDWDSFETSWDFVRHPLVPSARMKLDQLESQFAASRMEKFGRLAWHYENWADECEYRFNQFKANEENLNELFIEIYGLQDELTPDVEEKDVTVRKADLQRDIKGLISYAVGCMFGRYSLDVDGLAFAGGEWDASKYVTFPADKDSIIPICDDEYFVDDIVGRFVKFIEVVYGAETLDENLKFIADALGGKGQPKEVIRNYFMNDLYADHCKMYQKRPIYWLFDSGKKNGFKALIYMHRYQPDTIARIRTDYVHEQQARYRTALADLEQRIAGASAGERVKLNKKLKQLQEHAAEIHAYEEKIHHLADQMIRIDLDDGVKVNYAKFQDVLAKIK